MSVQVQTACSRSQWQEADLDLLFSGDNVHTLIISLQRARGTRIEFSAGGIAAVFAKRDVTTGGYILEVHNCDPNCGHQPVQCVSARWGLPDTSPAVLSLAT